MVSHRAANDAHIRSADGPASSVGRSFISLQAEKSAACGNLRSPGAASKKPELCWAISCGMSPALGPRRVCNAHRNPRHSVFVSRAGRSSIWERLPVRASRCAFGAAETGHVLEGRSRSSDRASQPRTGPDWADVAGDLPDARGGTIEQRSRQMPPCISTAASGCVKFKNDMPC